MARRLLVSGPLNLAVALAAAVVAARVREAEAAVPEVRMVTGATPMAILTQLPFQAAAAEGAAEARLAARELALLVDQAAITHPEQVAGPAGHPRCQVATEPTAAAAVVVAGPGAPRRLLPEVKAETEQSGAPREQAAAAAKAVAITAQTVPLAVMVENTVVAAAAD